MKTTRVNIDRLSAICIFIGDAWSCSAIDDATFAKLLKLIEDQRERFIDSAEVVVEHDFTICPLLDEFMARRRASH